DRGQRGRGRLRSEPRSGGDRRQGLTWDGPFVRLWAKRWRRRQKIAEPRGRITRSGGELFVDRDVEARVAPRQQVGVAGRLLLVAKRKGGEVSQPFGEAAERQRDEPAENRQRAVQVAQDPRDDEGRDGEDQPEPDRPAILRL